MDKTTPRPWSANNPYGYVHGRDGNNPIGHFNEWEDGKLAIKAVNSYDATQAALKALVEAAKEIEIASRGVNLPGGMISALFSLDKALALAQEVGK